MTHFNQPISDNRTKSKVTWGAFNIVAARLIYVEKSYWTESKPSRYIALVNLKNLLAFESKMAAKAKFDFLR